MVVVVGGTVVVGAVVEGGGAAVVVGGIVVVAAGSSTVTPFDRDLDGLGVGLQYRDHHAAGGDGGGRHPGSQPWPAPLRCRTPPT